MAEADREQLEEYESWRQRKVEELEELLKSELAHNSLPSGVRGSRYVPSSFKISNQATHRQLILHNSQRFNSAVLLTDFDDIS